MFLLQFNFTKISGSTCIMRGALFLLKQCNHTYVCKKLLNLNSHHLSREYLTLTTRYACYTLKDILP